MAEQIELMFRIGSLRLAGIQGDLGPANSVDTFFLQSYSKLNTLLLFSIFVTLDGAINRARQ